MTVAPFPRGGAHLHRVTGWLADLFGFTTNNPPADELARRIGAYASFLADAFPDDATFCQASLKHVTGECRFFPSYAEVHRSLGAWWRENRPRPPALPPPAPVPREPPTAEESEAVRELVRQFRANITIPEEARPPNWWDAYDHRDAGHLSDGQLLAAYERLAAEGNGAAATRLAMLRKKLGEKP